MGWDKDRDALSRAREPPSRVELATVASMTWGLPFHFPPLGAGQERNLGGT